MGYEYALTVPKGAKAGVYSKVRHFVPFTEIAAASVKDNGDDTETYIYKLGEKGVYSYRVRYADYTTVAKKFTMGFGQYRRNRNTGDAQGH